MIGIKSSMSADKIKGPIVKFTKKLKKIAMHPTPISADVTRILKALNGFWNDSQLGAGKWTENGTRRGSRSVSYSPNSVACGHTVGVLTVSVKGGCSIEVVPVASGILPVNFCPKCLL